LTFHCASLLYALFARSFASVTCTPCRLMRVHCMMETPSSLAPSLAGLRACVRARARARMVTRRPGRATTSRHAHTRRAAPCMFRSFVLQGRPSGRSTRTAKDAGTRSRQSLTRPAQHTHPPPSIPSAGVARPLANIAARTHARTGCWSMPRPRSIDRWIWMVHAAYRARMLYARAPLDLLRVN
jgi:hypothetical protein